MNSNYISLHYAHKIPKPNKFRSSHRAGSLQDDFSLPSLDRNRQDATFGWNLRNLELSNRDVLDSEQNLFRISGMAGPSISWSESNWEEFVGKRPKFGDIQVDRMAPLASSLRNGVSCRLSPRFAH